MLTVEILVGVWALCGLLAFVLWRIRKPTTASNTGASVVQLTASIVLGGIALFSVLTNDD